MLDAELVAIAALVRRYGEPIPGGWQLTIDDQDLAEVDPKMTVEIFRNDAAMRYYVRLRRPGVTIEGKVTAKALLSRP